MKLTYTRLWAASGQSALESSRILVISGSATSVSILKNLVLPGIGHFTILDSSVVTPEDAGNNFFLEGPDSIGKSRAEETVRLLGELNDSVEGIAEKSKSLEDILEKDKEWLGNFTVVIAHNLGKKALDSLSAILWQDPLKPPLVVVRSAGFLAEFYIQYHEHAGLFFVELYLKLFPLNLEMKSLKVIPKLQHLSGSTSRSLLFLNTPHLLISRR